MRPHSASWTQPERDRADVADHQGLSRTAAAPASLLIDERPRSMLDVHRRKLAEEAMPRGSLWLRVLRIVGRPTDLRGLQHRHAPHVVAPVRRVESLQRMCDTVCEPRRTRHVEGPMPHTEATEQGPPCRWRVGFCHGAAVVLPPQQHQPLRVEQSILVRCEDHQHVPRQPTNQVARVAEPELGHERHRAGRPMRPLSAARQEGPATNLRHPRIRRLARRPHEYVGRHGLLPSREPARPEGLVRPKVEGLVDPQRTRAQAATTARERRHVDACVQLATMHANEWCKTRNGRASAHARSMAPQSTGDNLDSRHGFDHVVTSRVSVLRPAHGATPRRIAARAASRSIPA